MLGASIAVVFVYLWALLNAESQLAVGALVLILPAVLWMLRRTGRAQAQSAPRVLGVGLARGKVLPFTFGNFLAGTAGTVYGIRTS